MWDPFEQAPLTFKGEKLTSAGIEDVELD